VERRTTIQTPKTNFEKKNCLRLHLDISTGSGHLRSSGNLNFQEIEIPKETCSRDGNAIQTLQGDTMNDPRLALAAIAALIVFFAWGFLTEGWLLRKDFAPSAALYRPSDVQMKYMPFGLASVLVALVAAVVLYAGWCGPTSGAMRGLQFGVIMGVFVACIHPISNLISMNMDTKLGLEIAASNAIGWGLAGLPGRRRRFGRHRLPRPALG
jgi:hypothetical protein